MPRTFRDFVYSTQVWVVREAVTSTLEKRMNLSDLRGAAEAFGALGGAPLAIEFSQAWHLTHSYKERQVDFAKLPGVYCPATIRFAGGDN